MFFMLGRGGGFRRIGPLGLAFGAYRAWQRLSPEQKDKIKAHAQKFAGGLRARRNAITTDAKT